MIIIETPTRASVFLEYSGGRLFLLSLSLRIDKKELVVIE